jgi:hypothetical protein
MTAGGFLIVKTFSNQVIGITNRLAAGRGRSGWRILKEFINNNATLSGQFYDG